MNDCVKIPICSNHIEQHDNIKILYKNGWDIEDLLKLSPEELKGKVLALKEQ